MVDIHSHILPGIDDGSGSMEESIEILKNAFKNGVTDLVLTPHYIFGSTYNADNIKKEELFNKLKNQAKLEQIPINLYLGNEVFVENNMLEMLEKNQIMTINKTSYLLFELPLNNSYQGIYNLLFKLKTSGIQPVIAHPERYTIFKNNPELIVKMLEQGALFQSNIGSFYGKYGNEARDLSILLLKHHAIHFISSDIHHAGNDYYNKINDAKKILSKYISDDDIDNLLVNNALHLLKDEKINKWEFIPFKKGLFGKLK